MSDILERLKSYQDPVPPKGSSVHSSPKGAGSSWSCWSHNGEKWNKIEVRVILDSTLKKIMSANYLLKVDDACFCGNDTVWKLCEGKKRYWLHDILNFIKGPIPKIADMKFKELLRLALACKILKAEII